MLVHTYVVKPEEIRNVGQVEKDLAQVVKEVDPSQTILELDYKLIKDPVVTASTGLSFQKITKAGFHCVVVKNHAYKEQLAEQAVIKLLVKRDQLRIE